MPVPPSLLRVLVAFSCLLSLAAWVDPATARLADEPELRSWIEGFKASPRGPFERIRWFCREARLYSVDRMQVSVMPFYSGVFDSLR